MTTVPGHNIVLQQSGVAQELTHQTSTPKPSPEQAAAQQQANAVAQGTTVQGSDESEKLKSQKEKEALRKKKLLEAAKKKQKQELMAQDPDAPGRLLDTTI
jgi:hypothetical protein